MTRGEVIPVTDLTAPDAIIPDAAQSWSERLADFDRQDHENPSQPGGIVVVGGSMIAMWDSLAEDLAPSPVINRGLPGATIADFLRYADRTIIRYKPAQILLCAGSNDLAGGMMPRAVFHDYHRFVDTMHVAVPGCLVTYLSIMYSPKRWDMREAVRVTNHLIAAYTKDHPHTEFINASALVLGDDGNPHPDLYVDGLHLNRAGYARLITAIRPSLIA